LAKAIDASMRFVIPTSHESTTGAMTEWRASRGSNKAINGGAQKTSHFPLVFGLQRRPSSTTVTSKSGLARGVLYWPRNDGRRRSRKSTASSMAFGRGANVAHNLSAVNLSKMSPQYGDLRPSRDTAVSH
jgi:hypothetical protein